MSGFQEGREEVDCPLNICRTSFQLHPIGQSKDKDSQDSKGSALESTSGCEEEMDAQEWK